MQGWRGAVLPVPSPDPLLTPIFNPSRIAPPGSADGDVRLEITTPASLCWNPLICISALKPQWHFHRSIPWIWNRRMLHWNGADRNILRITRQENRAVFSLNKRHLMKAATCNLHSYVNNRPWLHMKLTPYFIRILRSSLKVKFRCWDNLNVIRFDVFTAVTRKNAVFWDVTSCGSCKNWRFNGTYDLNRQRGKD
jgi:hypothetical protein